jgi:hypothetical protein
MLALLVARLGNTSSAIPMLDGITYLHIPTFLAVFSNSW